MCGIFGLVASSTIDVERTLARMGETIVHRGPDGYGARTIGRTGLGCRRLAIIDVEGGAQPLSNEAGDIVVVCNGEIYNHAALRRTLEAQGHRFRTRSDAEVLPHLYEEQGLEFLHALEGMFALALWDAREGRLVLARDRMGEKPLYYGTTAEGFFFASEPKAVLATGHVNGAPDWPAVAAYLRTGWLPGEASAFAGITKVPPGARLVMERDSIRVDRYWDVALLLASPVVRYDLPTAATVLRRHLQRAVEATLVSDVPVGVFLSGGLDSTAVTACARIVCGPELATFAVGFDESGFDESDHAAFAARTLGTRHQTVVVGPDLFLEGVHDLLQTLDEPLADPALVPTYLLARRARQEVKVVLVGEGGDELFAGYPTYVGGLFASHYGRLPAVVRRLLAAAAPLLGAPRGNTTPRWLLRRFLEAADAPPAVRHRAWTGCFSAEGLAALATPGGPLISPEDPATPEARSALDALLSFDLSGYLPDDLLVKLDRATMAASLEGRAPFLDRALVEFACGLPAALKLRGIVGKRVLRHAVADLVPDSILKRVKRGLTVPLGPWIAGPLRPFVRDVLARLDPHVVRRAAVEDLLTAHLDGRRDNRRELWALVMLQLWQETSGTARLEGEHAA